MVETGEFRSRRRLERLLLRGRAGKGISKGDPMRVTHALAFAAALLSTAPAAALAMYGSVGSFEVTGGPQPPGSVVAIDVDSGGSVTGSTLVGQVLDPGGLSGMVFAGTDLIYGTTRDGFGTLSSLRAVALSPGTDSISLVTDLGVISDGTFDLAFSDLAIQPGSGTLFGISTDDSAGCNNCLYTIDPGAGGGPLATLVGAPPVVKGGGLGFAPDGALYLALTWPTVSGSDPQFDIVTLDPTDASELTRMAVVRDVPLVVPGRGTFTSIRLDGLAVDEDGTVFGTGGGGATEVYELLSNGKWGIAGDGAANLTDLAFRPVPEPGGALLLALIGLRLRRRSSG